MVRKVGGSGGSRFPLSSMSDTRQNIGTGDLLVVSVSPALLSAASNARRTPLLRSANMYFWLVILVR